MAYNASKGAVRLMTKSAAVQFARKGIRVNSVHPGVLPAMTTSKATADPAFREKMLAGVPDAARGTRGGSRPRRTCSWRRTRPRTSRVRSWWSTAAWLAV